MKLPTSEELGQVEAAAINAILAKREMVKSDYSERSVRALEQAEDALMAAMSKHGRGLFALARMALAWREECEAWRRQDKGLCENHCMVFRFRSGLTHVPITTDVVESMERTDTLAASLGVEL